MPKYDYSCEKCGIIELEHGMNTAITICPYCGETITRRIGNTGFVLNGGGWAKDGYSKISSK